MLPVPIDALVAPGGVVVRPLRGVAFSGSCWVGPVAPGVHLAVCGPLGCPSIFGGRDNRSDDSHVPYRNPRNDGNCRYGGSCSRSDSVLPGEHRRLGGSPLSTDSRNRDGWHRRACSLRRGSNRPPNRGCHLYICRGDGVSRTLWELVAEQCLPFASFVALFV